MKFSLIQLLVLFVPIALLTLVVLELIRPSDLEWRKFSMADFGRTQQQEVPAIIVCRPDWFADVSWMGINEKKLPSDISSSFVCYRHDYRYWTSPGSYDERSAEDKWVFSNGGNKNPMVLLISHDGRVSSIKSPRVESAQVTQDVIEFLKLEGQSVTILEQFRVTFLLGLFGLSLAFMAAMSIRSRRRSTNQAS